MITVPLDRVPRACSCRKEDAPPNSILAATLIVLHPSSYIYIYKLQWGITALDWARDYERYRDQGCIKLLELALLGIPLDRALLALHCAGLCAAGGVSRDSHVTPLREFFTDEGYNHMIESTMEMVMEP